MDPHNTISKLEYYGGYGQDRLGEGDKYLQGSSYHENIRMGARSRERSTRTCESVDTIQPKDLCFSFDINNKTKLNVSISGETSSLMFRIPHPVSRRYIALPYPLSWCGPSALRT